MKFPHLVIAVQPVVSTDRNGSTVRSYKESDGATRVPNVPAWVQQSSADETHSDGRNAAVSDWVAFTLFEFSRFDRLEWNGKTFEVEGEPNPLYTPRGLHHHEVGLRVVEG